MALAAIALGLAGMILGGLLRRPGVSGEVPIAAGYAYFFVSMFCLFQALHSRHPVRWLAAASAAYGLAVAARPDYAFGSAALLIPLWPLWKADRAGPGFRTDHGSRIRIRACNRARISGASRTRKTLGGGHPGRNPSPGGNRLPASWSITTCALTALFEFGSTYQMSGHHERLLPHFSPRFFWYNLRLNLFRAAAPERLLSLMCGPVRIFRRFPRAILGVEGDPYGIIPGIPLVLFSLRWPLSFRYSPSRF